MKNTKQVSTLIVFTATGVTMCRPHAKICACFVLMTIALTCSLPVRAMLNPSSVYCRALGYEYLTAQISKGALGVCKLSETRLVDAFKFYSGLVAVDANYCSVSGYTTRHVEDNGICRNCAVCVLPNGDEVPVAQAMNLNFKESICGDDKCGTGENHGNCPRDCVSGLYDEFCDGVADQKCDKDCLDQELDDPDCIQIEPTQIDGGSADRQVQFADATTDTTSQHGVDASSVDATTGSKPSVPGSGCGCSVAFGDESNDTNHANLTWLVFLVLAVSCQRRKRSTL